MSKNYVDSKGRGMKYIPWTESEGNVISRDDRGNHRSYRLNETGRYVPTNVAELSLRAQGYLDRAKGFVERERGIYAKSALDYGLENASEAQNEARKRGSRGEHLDEKIGELIANLTELGWTNAPYLEREDRKSVG